MATVAMTSMETMATVDMEATKPHPGNSFLRLHFYGFAAAPTFPSLIPQTPRHYRSYYHSNKQHVFHFIASGDGDGGGERCVLLDSFCLYILQRILLLVLLVGMMNFEQEVTQGLIRHLPILRC